MGRQLALDLPVRPARGRSAFFVAPPNALAVAQIERWQDWPEGKLVLIGPAGSGKTHLVHVWADLTGATIAEGDNLPGADPLSLLRQGAVAVDGADLVAGRPEAETALFHLHNLALSDGAALLLTARRPARDWGLALPDLASRMQAATAVRVAPPDDTLLSAVLVKLFTDRQLVVGPGLISYLLPRIERSFSAAEEIVALIDREALASGRRPGVKLAREVLDKVPRQPR